MNRSPEQLMECLNTGTSAELDCLGERYGVRRRITDCEPDWEFRERIRPWVVREMVERSGIGANRAPRRALNAMGEMYGVPRKWWEWDSHYRRRVTTVIGGIRPQVKAPRFIRLETSDGNQLWAFSIPKWWLRFFG